MKWRKVNSKDIGKQNYYGKETDVFKCKECGSMCKIPKTKAGRNAKGVTCKNKHCRQKHWLGEIGEGCDIERRSQVRPLQKGARGNEMEDFTGHKIHG